MSTISANQDLTRCDPGDLPRCPKERACDLLMAAIEEECKDWGHLKLVDCEASVDLDGRLRLTTTVTLPSCGSPFASQIAEDLPTELLLIYTAVRRRIQSRN